MLVLTRKRLETIAIGDGIRITVVKLDRNQVRLGIEAPDDMMVLREELLRVRDPEADDASGATCVPATEESATR